MSGELIPGIYDEPRIYEFPESLEGEILQLHITLTEEGAIMDVFDGENCVATSSEMAEEIIERLMAAHGPVERYWKEHGVWAEYPGYPRADWQYEVANGDTVLGYWEWIEHKMEGI